MLITEDTIIADFEEVSATLESIADELGDEYAEKLHALKDDMDRLVAALRVLKKLRDDRIPA